MRVLQGDEMLLERVNLKRVLGIVGSPRRGGNTEILVDEVLRGAQKAGAVTEKIILSKLNVGPCQACDGCVGTGECVQQDDVPALLKQMEHSQVWVLGTPVYWWGPTAQFKAFLDRWYGARQVKFEGRRVILVIPLSSDDAHDARHTVGMLEDALARQKSELFATLVAPGVLEQGAVRKHLDVLEAARRAGAEAVTTDLSPVQEGTEEAAPSTPELDISDEATVWIDDLSKMTGPRLVVTGASLPLPQKQEVLIGRVKPEVTPVPDIDLVPHGGDQTGVSRHHARMSQGLDGWMLEDLNSTNGTFLNGVQVLPGRQARVRTGDIVRFGTLTLIFYE
jgi:multimeric flavodoxin WrbA